MCIYIYIYIYIDIYVYTYTYTHIHYMLVYLFSYIYICHVSSNLDRYDVTWTGIHDVAAQPRSTGHVTTISTMGAASITTSSNSFSGALQSRSPLPFP